MRVVFRFRGPNFAGSFPHPLNGFVRKEIRNCKQDLHNEWKEKKLEESALQNGTNKPIPIHKSGRARKLEWRIILQDHRICHFLVLAS